MKQFLSVLILISMFVITVQTSFAQNPRCEDPYMDVRTKLQKVFMALPGDAQELEDITWDPAFWEQIVNEVVTSGEAYLNECTAPDLTPIVQAWAFDRLRTSRIVPEMAPIVLGPELPPMDLEQAMSDFTPVVEYIDVNKDGETDVILHTRLPYFSNETIFGVQGGLSVVYMRDQGTWTGHIITPIPYFVSAGSIEYPTFSVYSERYFDEQAAWTANQALVTRPFPTIEMLNEDDPDHTYMAVTNIIPTPVSDRIELTILRWGDIEPEVALRLHIDTWCTVVDWDIHENGDISLPRIPDPFPHGCRGELAPRTFRLINGQYLMEESQ